MSRRLNLSAGKFPTLSKIAETDNEPMAAALAASSPAPRVVEDNEAVPSPLTPITSIVRDLGRSRLSPSACDADATPATSDKCRIARHSNNSNNFNGYVSELTDELITAQAFVFFLGGFETSSTTISHALYELALNQSIQDKLREEIVQELQDNKGLLEYESVKKMKYLEKVFYETLRKYPVLPLLTRCSIREYTFSELEVTIPEKTKVWIPTYAIQRDPEIYPDPETFDPERFDEEKLKSRHPSYFLSFGDGSRNCIGSRFGTLQSKIGLITILKNYKVEICDKTPIPYVSNNKSTLILAPRGGMILKFTKLN